MHLLSLRSTRRRTSGFFPIILGAIVTVTIAASPGYSQEDATFTISHIEPLPAENRLEIRFTESVSLHALRPVLKVSPPVRLHWYESSVQEEDTLHLHGQFKPGETYLITLPSDFRNHTGSDYRETVNSVTVPDFPPSVEWTEPNPFVERDSRQMVHVTARNVKELRGETLRIPPLLLAAVNEETLPSATESIRGLVETSRQWEQRFQRRLGDRPGFGPFLRPGEFNTHVFFPPIEKNKKLRTSLPLNFRPQAEEGAILLSRFVSNQAAEEAGTPLRRVSVTDIGLTYKRGPHGLLVWATSLRDADPLGGVHLAAVELPETIDANEWPRIRKTISVLGATDRDGLLYVTEGQRFESARVHPDGDLTPLSDHLIEFDRLQYLIAITDDDMAALSLIDLDEIKSGNPPEVQIRERAPKNVVSHRQLPKPSMETRAVVFTERGVYRPGETVHFKTVLRAWDEGLIIPPDEESYRVFIHDSKGQEVYNNTLRLSEFGSAWGEYTPPAYGALGTYNLYVQSATPSRHLAHTTFQVQEFEPPRHKVEIRFGRDSREVEGFVNRERSEEILEATISGLYFAGGPVKHGQVRWTVYMVPSDFPQKDYPHYSFGNPTAEEELFLETGETLLNEKGEVVVRVPLSEEILKGTYALKVAASVVDFDGRASSTTERFQVRPDYLVGMGYHPDGVQAEEPQVLRMLVLNPRGRPVRGGDLEVTVLRRSYYYYRQRDDEGNSYWRWDDAWREVYTTPVAIHGGEALFEFEFQQGGQHLIRARYEEDGVTYTSGTLYNVNGPRYWNWRDPDEPVYERVSLLPDKKEYQPGDDMRMMVRADRVPERMLLTIEREEVREYRFVDLDDGELVLPITEDMMPNVYVTLTGVLPREEFPTYQGEYDTGAPGFLYGQVKVNVRLDTGNLAVRIGEEDGQMRALPGERVSVPIEVTSEEGNGVAVEMAVAVVDERVLALTAYQTPTLGSLLDFSLPLDVLTGELRAELQPQTPFHDIRSGALTGGGGFGEGGKTLETALRKNLDPVAFFDPAIRTGKDGYATVTFTYPDTMTTYRFFVIATDKGGRFASAQKPALVRKDFYLEPGLPRFLTQGDTFQFSVAAFNRTDASGDVTLGVDVGRQLTLTPPSGASPLAVQDRELLPVEGTAAQPGSATLTFTGRFGDQMDRVQQTLPVLSGYVLERDSLTGVLDQSGAIDVGFPANLQDVPTDHLGPDSLHGTLTLSGSPFLQSKASLHWLMQYPYGCIEQTSSITFALAAYRDIVKLGYYPDITVADVDKYLQHGVNRIWSMQIPAGGFAYWPGEHVVSDWGTLYAMNALAAAAEAGIAMPTANLEKATNYLREQVNPDRVKNMGTSRGIGYRGLAAYTLSRFEALPKVTFDSYMGIYDELNREDRLFTLMAAEKMGYLTPEERQQRAVAALDMNRSDEDRLFYNARYRDTAVSLMAATSILGSSTRADRYAGRLLEQRKASGRWTSTSDTGWALKALKAHFGDHSLERGQIRGAVRLGGEVLTEFDFAAKGVFTLDLDGNQLLAHPDLTVTLDSEGAVLYDLGITYPRLEYSKNGYSNGFSISRTIENLAGSETIHVGDVVKVKIRFEPVGFDYDFVVIDDPLPAGFVAVNTAFATEQPVEPEKDDNRGYWWRYWQDGYYRFSPHYFEIRDERVLAFRNNLWHGPYQYEYYARAVIPGTFRNPPTKVQLMYDPETVAYTPETTVVIEAQR